MSTLHIICSDKFTRRNYFIELLSKELSLTEISIGNLIHDQILSRTEIGLKLEKELSSGNLIKSETIEELLLPELIKHKSILLEYYPRTQDQFDSLKRILSRQNIEFKRFWYLQNKNAINYGNVLINENELTIIDFTNNEDLTDREFRSFIQSFA